MLGGELAPGDELAFRGPYGAFRLRESERNVLMIAGGSGMAPILCLLRDLAARGSGRRVRFFYGGRTERDLFNLELISRLGAQLGDFRFEPVTGEFVHEAAERYLESGELAEFEAYMCGPPPMIDAALEMLTERHGHDADLIFWDKFTTSAEAEALR